MSYATYLKVLSQVSCHISGHTSGKKRIEVVINDVLIFLKKEAHHWVFSATVFHADEEIPPKVYECVSSSGHLKWEKGAALVLNKHEASVEISFEMHQAMTYLPFRAAIAEFLSLVQEWKMILEDLSDEDYVRITC